MTHGAVLFTLNTAVTYPRLFLGVAVAGLVVMLMAALFKKALDDAEDRGYEQGYEAYANELADDMAEEISEELNELAEFGDSEEYFRHYDD